ncbi:MAG: PspA/IM30 family protein [Thermomicrobiales bacterium]|nr:PspA/IM30 family protein [Thermomicrobiales bacterium]
MGVIDRVSRLVRANVNDLLDQAEDPEIMIDQIIRDMESNISDARKQVAGMIAQEKELEYDRDETQKLADAWGSKAERAVAAGKDDLAREALRRQKDYADNAKLYETQLTAQSEAVGKLKGQLSALEAKYDQTRAQRDSLVARQKRARAQAQIAEATGVSDFSSLDPSSDLDRMERKIRGQEARTAAMLEMQDDSIDAQFAELDYDSEIEDRLAELKASVSAAGEIPANIDSNS